MDQALVCVDHLFQIRILVCDEGERMIIVILFVNTRDLIQPDLTVQISCREDTSREVPSYRDKVDRAAETVLQLTQTLSDLGKVLVREWFVDRDIVVSPAEVGSRRRLYAGSRRTRDCVYMQFGVQHQVLGQW